MTGLGGRSGGEYFHSEFPSCILQQKLHINELELLSVTVALKLWGDNWKGKRIIVFCDNMVSVRVLNSGFTRNKFLQSCMREIAFLSALGEFELKGVHILGVDNRECDLLSRWNLSEHFRHEFMNI